MFRLNLTKHCIKWYCFIQMQLMDTFVHYFVLVSLYLLQLLSVVHLYPWPITDRRYSVWLIFPPWCFLWSMHCAFAAPVKYPDRDINRTRWKYIFHSMVCGLRDHSPLYVNLYVLGYEYCPCHYPPLHFYYCQIDKILTEEWVMTYIPAVSWSVFLLFWYTI